MTLPQETDEALQPALPATEGAEEEVVDDGDDVKLDMAADSLLAELNNSHEEVQRMLQMQQASAAELGGLKDQLAAELQQLQDEAWRLQTFNELEVLKRQLDALNGLEADLDAAEAVLDAGDQEPGEGDTGLKAEGAIRTVGEAGGQQDDDDAGGHEDDGEDDDDVEYSAADVEALQAKLDKELADMFAQLKAVRSEADSVSARKVQLEEELKALLDMQLAEEDIDGTLEGMPEEEEATEGAKKAVIDVLPVS